MIRNVRYLAILVCSVLLVVLVAHVPAQTPSTFTLDQILSAPFAADLTAAKNANRIAWTLNQQGKRNIWVAEGPQFAARQLTSYNSDDGHELSEMSISDD